jgi:hypothetical protein
MPIPRYTKIYADPIQNLEKITKIVHTIFPDSAREHFHPGLRREPDVPQQPSVRLHVHRPDAPHPRRDPSHSASRPRPSCHRRLRVRQNVRGRSKPLVHFPVEQTQRLQAEGVRRGRGQGVGRLRIHHLRVTHLGDQDGHHAGL